MDFDIYIFCSHSIHVIRLGLALYWRGIHSHSDSLLEWSSSQPVIPRLHRRRSSDPHADARPAAATNNARPAVTPPRLPRAFNLGRRLTTAFLTSYERSCLASSKS